MRCQDYLSILAKPEIQASQQCWTSRISAPLTTCSRCGATNLVQHRNSPGSRCKLHADLHKDDRISFLHNPTPFNAQTISAFSTAIYSDLCLFCLEKNTTSISTAVNYKFSLGQSWAFMKLRLVCSL